MILVLGGEHSGRLEYAATLKVSAGDIAVVTEADARAFAAERQAALDKDAVLAPVLSAVCARLSAFPVVIATEMGWGIIPLEAEERRKREENGRLNIALASLADSVVFLLAGIPRVIKGDVQASLAEPHRFVLCFRHGAVPSNLLRRYAGAGTDEELHADGVGQAQASKEAYAAEVALYPECIREQLLHPAVVYVSPMKRCLQTAKILFPEAELCIVPDFREMDFGLFEGKTASELLSSPQTAASYQAFVDEGAVQGLESSAPCPAGENSRGESAREFSSRTRAAFWNVIQKQHAVSPSVTVIVAHGGTQMALFSAYSRDKSVSCYAFQTGCALWRFGEVVSDGKNHSRAESD
ncbi:MAG: bifunctional adenosylcobinamide kinase/adenosylcobinamide-phosphate guanylyltransferase [Treponema sp.]|nr:bifunctional adenosylcobinamide kinase/adenosylcobinamide-phosphate guanylyltransferase [Treponema sp.]